MLSPASCWSRPPAAAVPQLGVSPKSLSYSKKLAEHASMHNSVPFATLRALTASAVVLIGLRKQLRHNASHRDIGRFHTDHIAKCHPSMRIQVVSRKAPRKPRHAGGPHQDLYSQACL
jgi:hypothetical protein